MIRELRFRILTKRYADEVYRFLSGMLGDLSEAEDAVQEVLLRLWRHMPEIPLTQSRAWLYRTARNHAIDLIRRRRLVSQPIYCASDLLPDFPDEDRYNPAQIADVSVLRNRLDRALTQLPEGQRSVFLLYEVNGLRYREIATVLDLPINSVKVYLSRARKNLQRQLKEHVPWIKT